LAKTTSWGSRVALLGDSEIVQNAYGLAQSDAGVPLFAADYILTERLAAWLCACRRPVSRAARPSPWIALDGNAPTGRAA